MIIWNAHALCTKLKKQEQLHSKMPCEKPIWFHTLGYVKKEQSGNVYIEI